MPSRTSKRGNRVLTGWGIEVRLPGKLDWHRLVKPGSEELLCTHLEGARAWVEDYRRRGCTARLVELNTPRGRAFRDIPRPVQTATLMLFN